MRGLRCMYYASLEPAIVSVHHLLAAPPHGRCFNTECGRHPRRFLEGMDDFRSQLRRTHPTYSGSVPTRTSSLLPSTTRTRPQSIRTREQTRVASESTMLVRRRQHTQPLHHLPDATSTPPWTTENAPPTEPPMLLCITRHLRRRT